MHRVRARIGAYAAALALAGAALPAAAGTVTGSLPAGSVVWISDGSPLAPIDAEMRNAHKRFVPDLLAVPVGSTVRFPNDDPFFHSIYSASDADPFDIGFYLTGPGKDVTFARSGVLEVRCHIHGFMQATIVVVDGPYASVAERGFALERVAAGEHPVHAWTPDGLRSATVRVPREGSVAVAF